MTRPVRYGDHPSQYAELSLPARHPPRGVVVVVHGGFWKSAYDLALGRPLAESVAQAGWAAWNLEYRRVGEGGGLPATLDDVAAGIDALADLDPGLGVPPSPVVTLGHSAGGHLAVWAAQRDRHQRWRPARVRVTAVIAQAGVLDLRAAFAAGLGGGAVERFLGHPPGPGDEAADPVRQAPLDVPVWCVHGRDDDDVPIGQSRAFVAASAAGGGTAELVEVAGDHYAVIDTASPAWRRQLAILESLARPALPGL